MITENQNWQILTLSHQAQFIITPNLTWWAIHTTVVVLCLGLKRPDIVELKEILKLHIYKMSPLSASSHPIFKIWVTLRIPSKGALCSNTREGQQKASADGQPSESGWAGWHSCLSAARFLSASQRTGQNFQDYDWVRKQTQQQPESGHQRSSETKVSWILMWSKIPNTLDREPWGRGCLNLSWDN